MKKSVEIRAVTTLICRGVITVLCCILCGFPALAQVTAPNSNQIPFLSPQQPEPTDPDRVEPPRPTRQGPTNRQEVASFMDQFFNQEMEKEHTPGAVVALVKDGEILFTKGYGYANLEKKIPVVPERTLFRVASISKLFTDTAVMQLYERGLLNLDTDVNQYLQDFQVKNSYPQAMTAAHLLTQTDATSQRLLGIAAPSGPKMLPLEKFVPRFMPALIYPPGTLYAYSNMGVTLLGYMVQSISGLPFTQYIDQNILQPLEMNRSSFQQPLPPSLAEDLAQGYWYRNGKFQRMPFLYFNIFPAAALSATATDMAHFMIAHLQEGRYQNTRLLEEDTLRLMHETHFTQHPQLPGTAYGFHEYLENNIRGIGHAGNSLGYSSSLMLFPAQRVGLFVATNNVNGLHGKLLSQFLNHYYPTPQQAIAPQLAIAGERYRGTYRDLEYPHDTFAKLTAPFSHFQVQAQGDNTLTVKTPGLLWRNSQVRRRLVPVEPSLFREPKGSGYVAFAEEDDQIKYAFNLVNPVIGTFERIPWYETLVFNLGFLGLCSIVFLSALVLWPGGYLIRRFRKQDVQSPKLARMARLSAGLVGLMYLTFLIGFPLAAWLIGVWKLVYGVPAIVAALLYLPPITAGLTLLLPVFAGLAWKNHYWTWLHRLHYTLFAGVAIAFVPFLSYWNLLGANF
jgi:CubicO group peptidase (beta-lactamase class C family)